MPRPAILAILALSLGACATEANFRKAADAYVGRPEADLVARLGTPDATHRTDTANAQADGPKMLTWRRGGAVTVPGYYQCVRGFCWVTPPQTYVSACEFTARVEAGVVQSYSYSGNGCRL